MLLKQLIIAIAAFVDVASGQGENKCPPGCSLFFDGCNNCKCSESGEKICNKDECEVRDDPRCLEWRKCPIGCVKWYDGCNTCTCDGSGGELECTELQCVKLNEPKCLERVCPSSCTQWFDGCNYCDCEGVGVVGTGCTKKACERYVDPMCSQWDDEEYVTFPELGLGKVVETKKKDQENFEEKLKEMGKQVPSWLNDRSNKPPKLEKKFKCKKKEKKLVNCDPDETCIRIKVPIKTPQNGGDSDSEDDRENTRLKATYKPFCLRPCSKVCTGISLRCGALADDPPKYPIWWYNFENRRCFQVERQQGTNSLFIRTTCKCPTRDYTVSDSCTPNAGASLSNCVQAYISQAPEINFQDLSSVQLGYVKSTTKDIDFQGKVEKSLFCRIDAHEDVEFGGGSCPAKLENNVFFNTVMNKDFQFEEGATLRENILFDVNIGDDFEVKDETGSFNTVIQDNLFGNIEVGDDCKIAPGAATGVTIGSNYCGSFTHSSGSGCTIFPFGSSGFSCL